MILLSPKFSMKLYKNPNFDVEMIVKTPQLFGIRCFHDIFISDVNFVVFLLVLLFYQEIKLALELMHYKIGKLELITKNSATFQSLK